ncbi:hypothetical protein [Mycolicibacterium smegmatis]|nr:hypothetical protein [Mycolicibacterium smegmatis]MCC3338594.1 hypothetical protein [Mycolicibacterium smegmatis]MCO4196441.1 hypothetical protein [Mycolicibacterium smegmatis]UUR93406.1 hypothetical protein NQ424_17120 [Mycolicibacterium smegmatis]UUR99961.1 hypothetical protein NQ426_17120 [Mycolicibacterium smegmatis]UUS06517.1 hypothetical protein NQ427_17125 [Mycolicibacterium smegmatis]
MSHLALLAGSVMVGIVIAAGAVYDYQRRAARARNVSIRSHVLSAVVLVLSSAVVGAQAVLYHDHRAFTIPYSTIAGLVGLTLLAILMRDVVSSKRDSDTHEAGNPECRPPDHSPR